jgi:uncharacterized membrane protein YhhN
LWVAAAVVGAGYGVFLILTALRLPSGAELTGQFALQPAVKALTAVLLAVAHLCFLAALIPLVSRSAPRLAAAAVTVLDSEALAVPIWWAYATSLVLISAGFFFRRASVPSATAS